MPALPVSPPSRSLYDLDRFQSRRRSDGLTAPRELGWKDLARLVGPFLWPRDSLELRVRVLVALAFLVCAKLVNISIPFFLKAVIDEVSRPGLAAIPLAA